ncbi:MAG: hypothetical protein GF405_06600 [Candidatus Eisenbacteria bacterium]|nr:hypothetical protein [Candidatus Eisenbacteria bacterium]
MPGTTAERIRCMERALFAVYGPQGWWPSRTDFETAVGAVLTQGTAWRNVERAVAALGDADLLSPAGIAGADPERLETLIRPAGFSRRKARTLRSLAGLAGASSDGFRELLERPAAELRQQLLGVCGIGRETADCILLYASGRPAFPVDTYARRVVGRHGILPARSSYETLSASVRTALGDDVTILGEFHALIVQVGKHHCGASPRCGGCPLEYDLPAPRSA